MAGIFRELRTTTFASAVEQMAFATTDWSQKQRFIGPFRRAFGRELRESLRHYRITNSS